MVSAVGGVALLGGSAAAYEGNAASTYPLTPGTSTLGTALYAVKPDDAAAENGIETITLDVGSEASVANVTNEDVEVAIRGGTLFQIENVNVSSSEDGSQLEITLPRTIQPQLGSGAGAGAEVAVKFRNFTTPSEPGTYSIEGTVTTPDGETDGPASVSYTVSQPELSFPDQDLSQFSESQQLNLTASIPGGGYVGVFTTTDDGSQGRLVGTTDISTSPQPANYTIDVSGEISSSQDLTAVAYTESTGLSVSIRQNQTFDPEEDDPLVVDGELLNATASISTLDVDGRLQAGGEYDQGERLYFDQGEASTGYQISRIEGGEIGPSATQFQTAANGTAIVDTTALDEGQYAITRVDDGSLVSLDNDSTTGPGDDSFLVTGQQAGPANGTNASANGTTNATATETANTTTESANATGDPDGENATETTVETSTAAATTTAAATEETNATAAQTDAGETNGSGQATEEGGPGFTAIAAVVAVLAAALLATRRR
ncbi:hypothetical protein C449_06930 [Halococcus saccharolyticus DSM 5350]|uniref:PGF-CTERM sorting domain-containing protein n=1 Tax=Halococcus saccharolyticus DSM 5350 TaxID=1227455 RepID=M0MKS2_9EURY|nr:hypothetical protein C449_06930 [Halococcus saccharolyticus DSM 5350]